MCGKGKKRKAFTDTKKAIANAAMDAPHMKEEYPIKWLKFHKAVIETLGTDGSKPYMTLNEAKALAAKCDITDESQFTTMLGLYHDLGTIIWFEEDKTLRNTVILDPQWLIDVFKAVITVSALRDQDPEFCDKWQELEDNGILRNELIDHVWKDWKDIKDELLELMEKFDLLFRRPADDQDEKEKDEKEQTPDYCVPACLHPKGMGGHEDKTDGKFYVEFDPFLPDGFFHRVLVHFARWSSQHTGVAPALLYRFCESVVGPENKRHECHLQMIQSSKHNSACIKIMLKNIATFGEEAGNEADTEVCTSVYEFMDKTLLNLKDRWAKGIRYTMTVCCVACKTVGKLHLIPVTKCKRGSYYCRNMKVSIPATQLYWEASADVSSAKPQPKSSSTSKISMTEEPGRHVMISYSWGPADKGFPCKKRMITLRDELQGAGYKVWLDVHEMKGNMIERMAEAVDGACCLLVCFSKEYQNSRNCKSEATYASYKYKPIIPLRFDEHKPDRWLGLIIGNLIYYDVQSENAMFKNLPKIIEEIEGYSKDLPTPNILEGVSQPENTWANNKSEQMS
ncbi:uncharacterized protein [Amphiura filiformis]|uniref:uncharacterized protein n=1 Tax=Amphiura filiformis TaxID=82378 RepID=UPI003B20B9CD